METKPGVYTTEFWLTVVLQILLALNTFEIWKYMPQKYTALCQAILGAAYMVARGLAKKGVPADPNVKANYTIVPTASDGVRR